MRKIFTLFAAMLLAITASATPTNVSSGSKALSAAITAATGGDTLLLVSTGDYTESSTYEITKNITIIAEDGKSPVIKARKFAIKNGARVEFKGVKFDASAAVSDHQITSYDATAGNKLILDSCDFYDFALNSSLIHCGSSEKLDSCIINKCTFKNIKKSCIFLEQTSLVGLIVTNSTFANINTVTGSYYAGNIHVKSTTAKVRVDQCTFYNVHVMSSSYGAVGDIKTTDAVVSNCIFAMPVSNSTDNTVTGSTTANNCLVYNYTSESGYGMPSSVTKNSCYTGLDPLFADSAKCDFSLPDSSPAKGRGVGGTHLGDPRWWYSSWTAAATIDVTDIELDKDELALDVNETAFLHATVSPDNATDKSVDWTSSDPTVATVSNGVVKALKAGTTTITATAGAFSDVCAVTVSSAIPSTDFASPYFLKGTKAALAGQIYISEADSLHYEDKTTAGTATWNLHASATGMIRATVNFKAGSKSGSKFNIKIYDSEDALVGEDSLAYHDEDGNQDMPHTLCIPAVGDYTIVLSNNQSWSSAKINGITLTKVSNLPTAAAKGGWDGWTNELSFTLAKNGKTASAKKNFNKDDEYFFKMLINGSAEENWRANGCWFSREITVSQAMTTNGDNMKVSADYTGEYTFIWNFETNVLSIIYPEPQLENGWYLVGTFNSVDAWNIDDLTAAKKFVTNPAETEKTELMITVPLKVGDVFKAAYVYLDEFTEYKPNGTGNDYVVDADHAGDTKTIYLRPNGDGDGTWWHSVLYVPANDPTAIDNTVVGEKAVKFFENGQLFIQKDGKTYNILGTIVK